MRQMPGGLSDGYPGVGKAQQSGMYSVRGMHPGLSCACVEKGSAIFSKGPGVFECEKEGGRIEDGPFARSQEI